MAKTSGQEFLNILCGSSTIEGLTDRNPEDSRYRATMLGWLNLVLKDIQNRQQGWHWRWLEKTATASTVAGQHSYDLPDDIDTNKMFALYDRTNDNTYTFVPYDRFVRLFPDPSNEQGTPRWWTFWANTIRLYPVPASAFTFYLDYIKNITLLTDDASSTTDVPEKFDEVIIDGALVYAYRFDPSLGDWKSQQQLYEAGIQKMINDNRMMINELAESESHRLKRGRNLIDGRNSLYFPMPNL